MNTPLFAKHPILDSAKVKIAPVHSDFGVATLRSCMGFTGRRLNWNSTLEVLRFLQCPILCRSPLCNQRKRFLSGVGGFRKREPTISSNKLSWTRWNYASNLAKISVSRFISTGLTKW